VSEADVRRFVVNHPEARVRAMRTAAPLAVLALFGLTAVVGAQPRDDDPTRRRSRAAGLRYQETVVGGGRASDRLPLVIALHQLGAGPRGAARVFDDGIHCPARVIAPRGALRHPPGFSFIDALAADPGDVLAVELRRGAEQLARFIEAVRRDRPTTGTPIVTGFSQGGMLTFALVALHPDVVGVAFPGAGFLPRRLWPRQRTEGFPPVVAFHGERDSIVRHEWARDTIAHFARIGVAARLQTHRNVGHRFTAAMKRELRALVDEAVCARGGVAGPTTSF
jgi:phospholipase/carboxylesterase